MLAEEYEGVLFDQDTVCGAPRKAFRKSGYVDILFGFIYHKRHSYQVGPMKLLKAPFEPGKIKPATIESAVRHIYKATIFE